MANLAIESTANRTLARLLNYADRLDPGSSEYRRALFMIGTRIRNRAVDNLTAAGAVDRGVLRAMTQFRIEGNGDLQTVIVGAFGVKYARMVEEGGPFTARMRAAMFASFRARGVKPRPGKGIISGGQYRGRPWLHPALEQERAAVMATIRDMIQQKGKA